jgi:hypothetical protein
LPSDDCKKPKFGTYRMLAWLEWIWRLPASEMPLDQILGYAIFPHLPIPEGAIGMHSEFVTPVFPWLVRWAARLSSLILLLLVVAIAIGEEQLPNLLREPTSVRIEFVAFMVIVIGLAIGWVREGLGGFLILAGLAGFNIVEFAVKGRPGLGLFPYFAAPGTLFLLSAWLHGSGHRQSARR